MPEACEVAVVGGGPVGLYLGLLLAKAGADVRVLERREAVSTHSRAVGLHPPALEAFDKLDGLGQLMAAAGVRIGRGVVRGPSGTLGTLSFAGTSATHPYVLALPQQQTETLLERALGQCAPGVLRRGVSVTGLRQLSGDVELSVQDISAAPATLRAQYVVAADGRRSMIRGAAGLPFPGRTYPQTYVMGDFPETSAYGPDAVITLSSDGVVESFPLPGGKRRWVAQTPALLEQATPQHLATIVAQRTNLHLPAADATMLSAFEVRRHLAPRYRADRIMLAGDAAHEVSPIGGQGMNLGWLDARDLAPRLVTALRGDLVALTGYGESRRQSALRAARQAEANMWLGRPLCGAEGRVREYAMSRLLTSPASAHLARAFTMRGL